MKNMKKWLLLAMCTLATSSFFSQQNDWAQSGRYAEANKSVQTPTRVVFMGNSITDGWWNTDSLFFKNNRYIGRGIGGQTTAQMLVRFRADVINLQPKANPNSAALWAIARLTCPAPINTRRGRIPWTLINTDIAPPQSDPTASAPLRAIRPWNNRGLRSCNA